MKLKLFTALTLAAAMATGCNTGSRDTDASYGVGSQTGSGGGTTTPGSGTGGGGGGGSVGTFSNGPDLNVARGQHTATVMSDGRVLVTGGTDGQSVMGESEVFDPVTNTWEFVHDISPTPDDGLMIDPTGQLATVRQLHTATLLNTGHVLIAGGVGVERVDAQSQPVFEALTTAYLFDPNTNSFSRTGSLPTGRAWHVAGIANGMAVVAGGLDANLVGTDTADVYNPAQGTWQQIRMGGHHTWGAMVSLSTQALVIGGAEIVQGQQGGFAINGFPPSKVESFANGQFAAAPPIATDVIYPAAAVSATATQAMVAGGQGVVGQALDVLDTTEIWDAQAWKAGPTLAIPRFAAESSEIGTSGDQIVVGGVDINGSLLADCEVIMIAANTNAGTVTMGTPRADHKVVTLKDTRVLVIGGLDDQGAGIASTELHTR